MTAIRPATGLAIVALQVMAACSNSDLAWTDTRETPAPPNGSEGGNANVTDTSGGVSGTGASSGGSVASAAGGVTFVGAGASPVDDGNELGGSPPASFAGEHAGGEVGSVVGGTSGTEGCPAGCCGTAPEEEALSVDGVVIAESRYGFSATQGKCGWSFGYLPRGEEPFTPLSHFRGSSSPVWQASVDVPPWSAIYREAQHPNQIPLQWIVRRWTSHVQGDVTISGHVAKTDLDGGDGIIAQVRVDGLPRWEVTIDFDDSSGQDFFVAASVTVGTTVDFIVAPKDGDAHDLTSFVASITW